MPRESLDAPEDLTKQARRQVAFGQLMAKDGDFSPGEGIRTVAELRAVELVQLTEWFGKGGKDLHERAGGISDDPVSNEWERKSVGEQETFEEDTLDSVFILGRARELAREVYRRFVADGFAAFRTATVTVRFTGFVTVSRSRTGRIPLTSVEQLQGEVRRLLEPFFDARENPKGKKIRLIGVRVEKLLREYTADVTQQAIAVTDTKQGESVTMECDAGGPEGTS
jgi:nucleotidyltransferase/DNA polymerase involved in DNA repair